MWKSKLGRAATYKALIKIFVEAGEADYADRVCDLLKEEDSNGGEYIISSSASGV